MDWDEYRFFLVSARSSSVRAAALTLGVSHSTVLRKLDNLEKKLGARLFDRRGSGFPLTLAGEDVLLGAAEVEDSLQAIERTVAGRDDALEGLVTVSMPEILADSSFVQELVNLKNQFPKIKVKIDMTYSVVNLAKREADIAVRFTRNPPEDLVGRSVGEVTRAAYATRNYVRKHKPEKPNSSAQWIGFGEPNQWIPNSPFPQLDYMGVFDNITLQIELAKCDQGIAYLPCLVADTVNDLVRISEPVYITDLWVLYHADLRSTTRVRVIRDFFLDAMKRRLALAL